MLAGTSTVSSITMCSQKVRSSDHLPRQGSIVYVVATVNCVTSR